MKEFFKVPNNQDRKNALGSLPGLPYRLKKAIQQVLPMFQIIDKPKPGDWLWDHEQQGQTFAAYEGQLHNIVDLKRNTIYIKPLEEDIDKNFLYLLQRYCQCFFYPMNIKVSKYSNILGKVSSRINQYTGKHQVNARQILEVLKKHVQSDAFCVVGVTFTDLYPKDQWNFVFGIASIRERTGVFSFARYDQRFFEDEPYDTDYHKILWRSIGVMIHQITHMFGVRHCIYYNCVMNGSNHDQQSKSRPLQLCPICLRKMNSNIKFDILQRYLKLQDFLNKETPDDKRVDNHRVFINQVIHNIQKVIKEK